MKEYIALLLVFLTTVTTHAMIRPARSLLSRQRHLYSTPTTIQTIFKQVPINVYIDKDIRTHMKMKNSDRKARAYLGNSSEISVNSLRRLVEKKFPVLKDQPYLVRYCLPTRPITLPKPLLSADDVTVITTKIEEAGSLQLYIEGCPGVFPPPSAPYMINMADPAVSEGFTMLSFYKFFNVDDPEAFSLELFELWKPFKAMGRVYVSKEGINAQCAVPNNVVSQFQKACETLPMFESGES